MFKSINNFWEMHNVTIDAIDVRFNKLVKYFCKFKRNG